MVVLASGSIVFINIGILVLLKSTGHNEHRIMPVTILASQTQLE